ncbi:ty3-gypsy retrotransposon protein, partial [Tanacetum coccineum]
MDENTVRLWLKDHQDAAKKLVRQQAEAFQLQLDTLRAELQATRGLFQNRQGGGGDQGLLLPRSMRLDVPKFSGDDLYRWILSITEYFSLLNTPADQHLRIVGFNLKGVAAEWFQWMSRNGLITTWDKFVESVKSHFGPSKYEDPQGALSKLLQLGTVEDYQREFEKLMNRVTDIPDSLLISFYISGLKLNLKHELLVSRPTTLGDAFSLAPLDTSEDTLLSLRSEDPNFKIQEKADEYVRALNVALLKVVFARPVDEVSSVIKDVFDIDESNVESMEVRRNFGELSKNMKNVEKVMGGGEVLGVGEDDDSGNAATNEDNDAVKSGDISIHN